MKLKMLAWPGLILLLFVGNFQMAQWLSIGDSPINIGGGSTYADAGVFNSWTAIDAQGVTSYLAKSPGKNLALHGLLDDQGNDRTSTLTNPGKWLVFFNTPYPSGYPASISFCSDPAMPAGFPLQPSTLYCNATVQNPDPQSVYVQANDNARWEKHSEFLKSRLHFHNRHCDGDVGTNETYCDAIMTVYVTVTNDNAQKPINGVPLHCKVEKDCYVRSVE